MKKGLLLTLVVVVALLSSSSFAYAPVLKNIPDIIIGDHEQGDTENFFVFSDAFVFDTYVNDQDSTEADLKWSYVKTGQDPTSPTQTIIINDLDEETADYVNPTNDIRNGFNAASFRNDTLSPRTGHTPYDDPAAAALLVNVHLALYVSDGAFTDSDEIDVYAANNDEDGYSGLGIDPSFEETWETVDDWAIFDGVGPGTAASSYGGYDSVNKRLRSGFPSNPFTGQGWTQWLQWNIGHTGINTVITYKANTAYVLKVKLSADANTTVPQLRIRTQTLDNMWSACALYAADGTNPSQGGVPQTTPADFYLMWEPQGSTADGFIAIDGISGLTANLGEIYIDDLKIYEVPLADITASAEGSVTSYTGWLVQGSGITVASTSITYADTTSWGAAGQFITLTNPLDDNNFYKLTYPIRKSGSAATDQVRMRVSDTYNGNCSENFVLASGNPKLTTSNANFYMYHRAVNGRATTPFAGDLTVLLDTIQAIDGASSVILSTPLTIEKLALPPLN